MTLPVQPTPLPDEPLSGYVLRLAALYGFTHRSMWSILLSGGGKHFDRQGVNLFDLDPTDRLLEPLRRSTGRTNDELRLMTLASYDGVAIERDEPPTSPDAFRWPMRGAYLRTSSLYCVECLHEEPHRWRTEWRLPYQFGCIRHGSFLQATCPHCGGLAGPTRAVASFTPDTAGEALPHSLRARHAGSSTCDRPPTPGQSLTPEQMRVCRDIDILLHGPKRRRNMPLLWTALRWAEASYRGRQRQEALLRTQYWPPRPEVEWPQVYAPHLASGLRIAALPVGQLVDDPDVRQAFAGLSGPGFRRYWMNSSLPVPPGPDPLAIAFRRYNNTKVRRTAPRDPRATAAIVPQTLPQMLPEDLFVGDISDYLHEHRYEVARMIAAVCLARRVTGQPWVQAVECIELPAIQGLTAQKSMVRLQHAGWADDFDRAIADALARMIDAPHPDYAARRRAVQLNPDKAVRCMRRFLSHGSHLGPTTLVPWLWEFWAHGYRRTTPLPSELWHRARRSWPLVTEQLGENVNPLFNALDATFTIPWSRDAAADSA